MLKNNIKKIISLILVLFVVGTATIVFAAENDNDMNALLNELFQGQNGNVENNGNVEQIQEGKNTNANTGLNTKSNTNVNVNENRQATTPHAGLEEYTGLVFVAIFAVSAVYAYKTVKEYNA
jgi:hypothetical protein